MQTGTVRINTKFKTGWVCPLLAVGCFLLISGWFSSAVASTGTQNFSTWFVDMSRYSKAAHGSLKCEECHGSMLVNGKNHPESKISNSLKIQIVRNFDYQVCDKCHKNAWTRYLKGEHAKAAAKEKITKKLSKSGYAPTCGDCHSAHYSKSHLSRVKIGQQMTETCGKCHPAEKKSYLSDYHGRTAVNLGYDKSASCTDCHGAHTTISLKNQNEALKACRRCHADATPEFANIIIHNTTKNLAMKSDTKKTGLKWLHLIDFLSLFFVIAVLAFFYMHAGLLMLRKLYEKLRKHK